MYNFQNCIFKKKCRCGDTARRSTSASSSFAPPTSSCPEFSAFGGNLERCASFVVVEEVAPHPKAPNMASGLGLLSKICCGIII